MNISVVGLGKLGLCTAACFASRGHKVIGVDTNAEFVRKLKNRQSPIDETGLEELLSQAWPNLSVADRVEEAVGASDVTLIIVPTPSEKDGRFTNRFVLSALDAVGAALRAKSSFHVVDVVSTVMPGSSDAVFKPHLEKLTGKVCGRDFGLVYNPEFIALGSVIRDFLNPDMVLIGASDRRSGDLVAELYRTTCLSRPRISLMSLVNAEITKLSLNCFVTMKISFVNELSSICDRVPGADIDAITQALGADTRIGNKYLRAGLGFGGPCFPRDNIAFQAFAGEYGTQARIGAQVVTVNNAVVDRIAARVGALAAPGSVVAVLGLAYKPCTHIVEQSHGLMLAKTLAESGYRVSAFDPKANASAQAALPGLNIRYASDAYACVQGADTIVLMTDWPELRELDWEKIAALAGPKAAVIDSWRALRGRCPSSLRHVMLGAGNNIHQNEEKPCTLA